MPTRQISEVTRGPWGWSAAGAFTFPEIWRITSDNRSADLPVRTSTFIGICFEETACSNVAQKPTPIALGPAQLQVSEDGQMRFFAADGHENFMGGAWDSSLTTWAVDLNRKIYKRSRSVYPDLPPLLQTAVLSDKTFSVRMHLKFFQWMQNGFGVSGRQFGTEEGLIAAAQTGGGMAKLEKAFYNGGTKIDEALARLVDTSGEGAKRDGKAYDTWIEKRRQEFAAAVQFARVDGHDSNAAVSYTSFKSFWEFFLPDEFLANPFDTLVCG